MDPGDKNNKSIWSEQVLILLAWSTKRLDCPSWNFWWTRINLGLQTVC